MSEFLLESGQELGSPFRMYGKDGTNEAGATGLNARNQSIGAVAEGIGDGFDALAGFSREFGLPGEDTGNAGNGEIGCCGDVLECWL